jgi:hypothetical protein
MLYQLSYTPVREERAIVRPPARRKRLQSKAQRRT